MKVLTIADTHFPFHDKKSMRTVMALIKSEKPDVVVQIGDLLDQYVFSRYPRRMGITPETDVKRGLKLATEMWETVRHLAPKAECIQILGNHDLRIAKRIAERVPELAEIYDYHELYEFDGVETLESDRDFIEIDGVVYTHGWLSKSIDHAKHFVKPTVHGHRHRPTIETFGKKLWSMDVGFLGDENQVPLQYTQSRTTNWRQACGIVEDGQPRLVLL